MKKPQIKVSQGTYSIETLFHFKCGSCLKWWSIGDPKKTGWNTKKALFCPLCGHKQKVVKSK